MMSLCDECDDDDNSIDDDGLMALMLMIINLLINNGMNGTDWAASGAGGPGQPTSDPDGLRTPDSGLAGLEPWLADSGANER